MNNILNNQRFLIVFDLDGTLLTSEKTIAPKTKSLLQKLVSLGNIVTIASGRPNRSVKEYMDELNVKEPFISYNGSLITNPFDESFTPFEKRIPKENILAFLSHFGEDSFLNLMIEDGVNQYYLRNNEEYVNFFHPQGMNLIIGSILKNLKSDALSCVIQVKDRSKREEMQNYLYSINSNMNIRYWNDSDNFGEFYFYDSNKATSILRLAERYHIDRPHIICFGDAGNDIQMIQSAGISFAMKNGIDELKKYATFVTKEDNDHEGIYYSLKELFEKEI